MAVEATERIGKFLRQRVKRLEGGSPDQRPDTALVARLEEVGVTDGQRGEVLGIMRTVRFRTAAHLAGKDWVGQASPDIASRVPGIQKILGEAVDRFGVRFSGDAVSAATEVLGEKGQALKESLALAAQYGRATGAEEMFDHLFGERQNTRMQTFYRRGIEGTLVTYVDPGWDPKPKRG